jgi:NAD(P)-dependent dehydrogenase (short-subunit alcohol dehydrogenase family)
LREKEDFMKLLDGKMAVIYGAAGVIGTSVAKTFAKEGADVILTGRTLNTLESLAGEISKAGGFAEVAQVDALDSKSVGDHLQKLVGSKGKLDISFNLIGTSVGMGSRLTELSEEKFMTAAFSRVRSYFLTSTLAARIMQKQGKGVILGLTTPNSRLPQPNMGGFSIGGAAIEALCRQLALEVGPQGVRVVCLRAGGTSDSPVLQEVYSIVAKARGTTKEAVEKLEAERTALKRSALNVEVANAAVLMASDYASAITATTVNASCGELVD